MKAHSAFLVAMLLAAAPGARAGIDFDKPPAVMPTEATTAQDSKTNVVSGEN